MKKGSFLYFILGVFSLMVSWYFNKSVVWLIIHWLIWPLYLLWCLITGHFSDGQLMDIINYYF
jgi:hypothetical protein